MQNSQEHLEQKRSIFGQAGKTLVANKLKGKAFVIPSLITALGIFCGFLSAISSFQGKYEYAAQCIMLAVVVDFLDGRVARRLNATSEFGKELDSLSDLIAFGLAPAVMLYTWGFGFFADKFGILIAYIYVACGAIRLARFNVTVSSLPKNVFQGLPIPGAAGVIATICYALPFRMQSTLPSIAVMLLAILLSLLMVSSIPYPNGKNLKLRDVDYRLTFLILSIALALCWYNIELALLCCFGGYMIAGPINYMRLKACRQGNEQLH